MKKFCVLTSIIVVFSALSSLFLFDEWGLFAFSGALILLPALYFTLAEEHAVRVRSAVVLGLCLSSCLYHLTYLNFSITVWVLSYLCIKRRRVSSSGDHSLVLSLVNLPRVVLSLQGWLRLSKRYFPNIVAIPVEFGRLAALPLLVAGVFLLLFVASNPVIEHLLDLIGVQFIAVLKYVWALIGFRSLFQALLVSGFMWHLFRGTVQRKSLRLLGLFERTESGPSKHWRSLERTRLLLLLLVPLFAFHLTVDFYVLATGAIGFDGMSYADWAHRGANILIVTILLSVLVIVLAVPHQGEVSRDPLCKKLLLIWVLQNILLLSTVAVRILDYIGAYGLTYLRFSTLVWLAIVLGGLIVLAYRIKSNQSNLWLAAKTLQVKFVLLLLFSFVNVGSVLSWYNITHCREAGGTASILDVKYLEELGPAALPAIEWVLQNDVGSANFQRKLKRIGLRVLLRFKKEDWRRKSLADYHSVLYLQVLHESTIQESLRGVQSRWRGA